MKTNQNLKRNADEGFDLIGDLHGHARLLRDLLGRLGYEERGGVYRHPTRRAIFLGDFIDRGPEIAETLRLARGMVEAGSALAVMGNHEYNALLYARSDGRGGHLRPHTQHNEHQHRATLEAFKDVPDLWQSYLDWFLTLPLWLELPGLRVVHAAWDNGAMAALNHRPVLDETLLRRSAVRGNAEFKAVETLLKGVEVELPDGFAVVDRDGRARRQMRTKWWLLSANLTLPELAVTHGEGLPAVTLSALEARPGTKGYGETDWPVFLGHYGLQAANPAPMTRNVGIVDYNVAGGGPLVAYRWSGEQRLSAGNFVSVRGPKETVALTPEAPPNGQQLPTYERHHPRNPNP
jgi:hypothetical protein